MKNPFRSERGTLTSGRACAVYALAFVLMLFLDATRFSSFLDRAGIDFPPAAVVGQTVKGVAEATGLAAFSEAETLSLIHICIGASGNSLSSAG